MSIAVEFDVEGVRYLNLGLNAIARKISDTRGLLRRMGAEVKTQTKERIQSKKRAPDGTPWKPWSADYAATRHANHSLLINEGHLQNSISFRSTADVVSIGSHLEYARIHQLGGKTRKGIVLPARPYLDVELEDPEGRHDLEDILGNWAQRQLEAARAS